MQGADEAAHEPYGWLSIARRKKLLEEINKEAKAEGIDRSTLIQTALEKYFESKWGERAEQKKRQKLDEACRKMDAVANKLAEWDPQATIRKFRDTNLKRSS
jgi:metal-responsive CopG/Arc/MetJ family transcriptional regulator